ncbi:MAG: hypothetical protein V7603_5540 [Micromonosporaceae bacterium]|jgi:hypothetical protein
MSQAVLPRRVETYDLREYPFPSVAAAVLGIDRLESLHEHYPLPEGSTGDQDAPVHAVFYQRYPQIRAHYERFLRERIAPDYGEDLCVQRVPSFRVQYPGVTASREFHRDSDYNHQTGTINYWLPVTRAFATNTVWIETEPDAGEFHPVEMSPGQFLRFDALRLKHGSHPNGTGVTRVSFDFRVLPLRMHRYSGLRSGASGVPLELGGYYMLLTRRGEFTHVSD